MTTLNATYHPINCQPTWEPWSKAVLQKWFPPETARYIESHRGKPIEITLVLPTGTVSRVSASFKTPFTDIVYVVLAMMNQYCRNIQSPEFYIIEEHA